MSAAADHPAGPTAGPGDVDEVDIAVVGAGGAGLAVLHALAHHDLGPGLPRPLRVAVIDPVPVEDTASRHRTWCFWADGAVSVAPAVRQTWRHVRVRDDRRDLVVDLAPFAYHLVGSQDLAHLVQEQLAAAPRLQVRRLVAAADRVDSVGDHALVHAGGEVLRARLVLDSRPSAPGRTGTVWWWQHFRGWTLPAGALPPGPAGADPTASLMDFRTRQPAAGLSFGYLLPLPDGRALAEYTEFSPTRLDDAGYDEALRGYLEIIGVAPDVVPEHVETGAIPMTDAVFTRQVGPRVIRIGTAGGATRGSTGYTFAAMLRDGAAVADLVARGALDGSGPLTLPPAYPARHRWMDGVMLRALDEGRLQGPAFFTDLFGRAPAPRVLRFLDGTTSLAEDLGIIAASPKWPMTAAAFTGAAASLRRGAGRGRGADGAPVPVPTRR